VDRLPSSLRFAPKAPACHSRAALAVEVEDVSQGERRVCQHRNIVKTLKKLGFEPD